MSLAQKMRCKDKWVKILWIGQAGFILESCDGRIIVIDPYLSHSVEKKEKLTRMMEIALKPEDIAADLVLCTHDHLDHTDPETLLAISGSSQAHFAGPTSSYDRLIELGISGDRLTEINRGETKVIAGVDVTAVHAKHTADSVGYVLNLGGIIVYHTGDTEYDAQLRRVKQHRPAIMLVCINGKWDNMDIAEAVKLACEIQPKVVIPMHYGMFLENTADPHEFAEAAREADRTLQVIIVEYNTPYTYRCT